MLEAALLNIFLALLIVVPLWSTPPGAEIRPMGLVSLFFLLALTAALVGIPHTIKRYRENFMLMALAIYLYLMPLLFGGKLMNLFAYLRGFTFSE